MIRFILLRAVRATTFPEQIRRFVEIDVREVEGIFERVDHGPVPHVEDRSAEEGRAVPTPRSSVVVDDGNGTGGVGVVAIARRSKLPFRSAEHGDDRQSHRVQYEG
jgi:hypothetical protein